MSCNNVDDCNLFAPDEEGTEDIYESEKKKKNGLDLNLKVNS